MNQFVNNRYVQLAGLVLGIGIILYLVLLFVISLTGAAVAGFVPLVVSFGASIWFVWKFMAYKIG